jgi:arylsulfatase A-like enzyme
MTIDILPTIARLSGADLPEHPIDGKNIWPLISGEPDAVSPHEAYYFYYGSQLHAIRMGKWKLHFPHGYRTLSGRPGGSGGIPVDYDQAKIELALFNLDEDVGETTNVAPEHPEVVARLQRLAEAIRSELGDSSTKQRGTGVRPAGRVEDGELQFVLEDGQFLPTPAR